MLFFSVLASSAIVPRPVFELVLRRPIETARVTGKVDSQPRKGNQRYKQKMRAPIAPKTKPVTIPFAKPVRYDARIRAFRSIRSVANALISARA
jgi:hypothetical protein